MCFQVTLFIFIFIIIIIYSNFYDILFSNIHHYNFYDINFFSYNHRYNLFHSFVMKLRIIMQFLATDVLS